MKIPKLTDDQKWFAELVESAMFHVKQDAEAWRNYEHEKGENDSFDAWAYRRAKKIVASIIRDITREE